MCSSDLAIPTSKKEIFSTAADNQPGVEIHVLQGEREMANDNRTLGRFKLEGIPPAPRGVPQVEVTFDIDANGILSVSAKDLGTGKEQRITIEASSGLSEAEVERMRAEAEANAESDRATRELIDLKNQAEQTIYQTDKALEEHKDKLDEATVSAIESAKADLERAKEGKDAATLKASLEAFSKAAQKLGEVMYKAQQAEAGAEPAGSAPSGASKEADDIIDADFEVKN